MDLVLVLDESGSMWYDVQKMKDFTREITAQLELSCTTTLLGIVGFATAARELAPMTIDRDVLDEAVDNLRAAGMTSISSGLDMGLDMLSRGRYEYSGYEHIGYGPYPTGFLGPPSPPLCENTCEMLRWNFG